MQKISDQFWNTFYIIYLIETLKICPYTYSLNAVSKSTVNETMVTKLQKFTFGEYGPQFWDLGHHML